MSGIPTTDAGTLTTTGGVGGTTFGALSSIGSDLSVSVSFNIARELLSAAADEQISEDELIGLVLGFTIILTALQARLSTELSKRKLRVVGRAKKEAEGRIEKLRKQVSTPSPPSGAWMADVAVLTDQVELFGRLTKEFEASFVEEAGRAAAEKLSDRRSMLDFLHLLVSICQRITVAISVQLLAASVRAQQPSRLVRTVSLIGLATFFVFIESLTSRSVL